MLVTNDPWDGTGHLNDFTVVTPVFDGNRAVALFAATSHIADVGGRGFGPDAGELFEEGLRVPIMKLFDRGEPNDALLRLVAANVRDPVVAGRRPALAHRLQPQRWRPTAGDDARVRPRRPRPSRAAGSSTPRVKRWRRKSATCRMASIGTAMTVDGYDQPLDIVCALTVSGRRHRHRLQWLIWPSRRTASTCR